MSDALTLRERLLRDFGVDLPIHGGTGRRDAPIVVSTADLQSAVDVQMTAIGCFGKGRGIAWRLVEQEIVDAGLRTVRVGIETVEIGERDVTTQQEACYFALDAMPTNGTVMSLPAPSGFVDPSSGLRLPYQLGWLQFDGSTDNEPAHPGLGWSVAYGGLGIQATVYAYDQGKAIEPNDLESERVQGEFRTAVEGVLGVNPGASVVKQGLIGDASARGRFLLAVLELPEEKLSAALLTVRNGYFVKARLTWQAKEAEIHRMAQETIGAIIDAVHGSSRAVS